MNIKFIKNKGKNNISRRNIQNSKIKPKKIIFLLFSVLFLVGIISGIMYFKNILDNNYFNDNPNILADLDLSYKESIESSKLFSQILIKNLKVLLFIWIVGLSILGIPILIFFIMYDGFSFGVSLSYILSTYGFYKGYSFIYSTMYLVSIINTISMIALCHSALKVTINILTQKSSIKKEFIRHSTVCVFMLILLVFSSLIELYLFKI